MGWSGEGMGNQSQLQALADGIPSAGVRGNAYAFLPRCGIIKLCSVVIIYVYNVDMLYNTQIYIYIYTYIHLHNCLHLSKIEAVL